MKAFSHLLCRILPCLIKSKSVNIFNIFGTFPVFYDTTEVPFLSGDRKNPETPQCARLIILHEKRGQNFHKVNKILAFYRNFSTPVWTPKWPLLAIKSFLLSLVFLGNEVILNTVD